MVHFLKLWEAVGGPRLRGDDAFFLRGVMVPDFEGGDGVLLEIMGSCWRSPLARG